MTEPWTQASPGYDTTREAYENMPTPRFVTGERTIHARVLGDLIRPTITDTEKNLTATFVPDTDVTEIADELNAGTESPETYQWEMLATRKENEDERRR